MRKLILNQALALRLSESQRRTIEYLAMTREVSLGQVARELIEQGIESLNVKIPN